jgi:hypothetical protein
MTQNKAKLIFLFFSILVALLLALITTYLYGEFHQHDRYWRGTAERIQKTESNILAAVFDAASFRKEALVNPTILRGITAPIDEKLAVTVKNDKKLLFTNLSENKTPEKVIHHNKYENIELRIESYHPPLWRTQFASWIITPKIWFNKNGDFITYPLIAFWIIYLICMFALGWRTRAKHLSEDVIRKMNEIRKESTT